MVENDIVYKCVNRYTMYINYKRIYLWYIIDLPVVVEILTFYMCMV